VRRRYFVALVAGFDEEPLPEDLESDFELEESDVELLSLFVSALGSEGSLDLDEVPDLEPARLSFL
jgi:hypothetical protein